MSGFRRFCERTPADHVKSPPRAKPSALFCANLTSNYPGLREQLFEGDALQRYVNVYVNDEDIQYLEKLATPVGPKDTVVILPAMAGG